jgi:SAM-dependent methyltransferase
MFMSSAETGTLLDIGCGDGKFLNFMAQRGWRVAGVDFDAEAVSHARNVYGLDVHIGTAQSCVSSGRRYDVVTASHVIEHVAEPLQFLEQCRRLLQPGGRIILRTPNAQSFGHRIYGAAWRGLEPPRHLQIFTLPALSACARAAGLRVVSEFTTTAESEAILIMSHFLRVKGFCRPAEFSRLDLIKWAVLAPYLAARAKWVWWWDERSGEELYMILEDGDYPVDSLGADPQGG